MQGAVDTLIDAKNVVQLLISADYLKMRSLAKACTKFFIGNLKDLMQLQVDTSALNSNILRNISKQMSVKCAQT